MKVIFIGGELNYMNDQILNDIKDQLIWDSQVFASNVDVSVSGDGEVTLNGTVNSFSSKRAAEADAWSILGVTQVENNLTVEYPATVTVPSDDEIKTDVDNVLYWNTAIDSSDIDVEVTAGTVTLDGTVDFFWKKLRAEELASDVLGVIDVVNNLAVVPTDDIIDKDIATDIISSLERRAAADAENVTVQVEDGIVTLSGVVASFNEWEAAYDAARFTTGIIDVNDNITISYK